METKQLETKRTSMKSICNCIGCRERLSSGKRWLMPTEHMNWNCFNCGRHFSMTGQHNEESTDGSMWIKIQEFLRDGLGVYREYHLLYNATSMRWTLILAFDREAKKELV